MSALGNHMTSERHLGAAQSELEILHRPSAGASRSSMGIELPGGRRATATGGNGNALGAIGAEEAVQQVIWGGGLALSSACTVAICCSDATWSCGTPAPGCVGHQAGRLQLQAWATSATLMLRLLVQHCDSLLYLQLDSPMLAWMTIAFASADYGVDLQEPAAAQSAAIPAPHSPRIRASQILASYRHAVMVASSAPSNKHAFGVCTGDWTFRYA